ncbi:fork-head transcriptional regulator Fhl1p [[Candida] jaroonii]|uniref:Fork-head transcriptional regulator Fhl1p n=1 Tax=[Candida] jaroonii TaxID=467808 RepID=A0ACA9Y168_9ASCO|nr:fork-head transcriptional regulator Fhl1p [[Candida] jaroonii]
MSSLGDEVIDKGPLDIQLPRDDTIGSSQPKDVSETALIDEQLNEQQSVINDQVEDIIDKTMDNSLTPLIEESNSESSKDQNNGSNVKEEPRITSEAALGTSATSDDKDNSKISAYARLDFDNYTFFVQTLQVVLGRKSNDELLNGSQHAVDVHLSSKKAISRRHAKIFYNFGTQRFELSIMGRNGAFVDDSFLEKGMTVPLVDGTKIQIGDIPFQFVLPSIELDQLKDTSMTAKPINPIDAISLRTNLYNSPAKKDKRKSILENRRNSIKIPRKLSEARRKSLATATNEEISTILSELGVKSIDDIDEQDPDFVDAQIRAILGDGHESAIIDDEDEDLSHYNEGEEDEIDKLVKQHNLEQGVELDESVLERDDKDIDMDLSVIDEEIVNLAPLIDAHNQELLREKEERKRQLEEEKRLRQEYRSNNFLTHQQQRTGPLMGKPATPRMGKPAAIQPPASRLYGRPHSNIPPNSVIDSRLMSMSPPPQHAYGSYGYKMDHKYSHPQVPELLVPIRTIEQKPLKSSYDIPVRKITTGVEPKTPKYWEPRIISNNPIMVPKIPKRRKDISTKKPNKNTYTMNDIPEHYRTKPSLSFPVIIINVLKYKNDTNGLTINEINEAIKEVYPYYKYCPDGWQSIVVHNVKLNKLFKTNSGMSFDFEDNEKWIIDESFVQEKEIVRKKQQEIATQKAKEAAIRAEELKQKQRLEMQQSISQNVMGKDFSNQYGLPLNTHLLSQSQQYSKPMNNYNNQYNSQFNQYNNSNGQKPKTIAELASEIRRDGIIGSKAPMYFKPQETKPNNGTNAGPGSGSPTNIKAQLAANRSQYSQSPTEESKPGSPAMNQDTKKSLSYLQKELFTLYKARKLSYNTTTTTEIITKALATTIAQVNAIGSKAGVGDNALSFLVDKAPQQVSKILDIALSKSIKEKQGILSSSKPASTSATPGASTISSPKINTVDIDSASPISAIAQQANSPIKDKSDEKSGGLGKPPAINKDSKSNLVRPPSFKPSTGLSKPPFISTKPPSRPGYGGKPPALGDKRPNEDANNEQQSSNKSAKTEGTTPDKPSV